MNKRTITKIITQNNKTIKIVDVFPLISVDNCFTYSLEANLEGPIVGLRVLIPFKNRKVIGIVYKEHNEPLTFEESKLKKIIKVIDDKPIISDKMIQLAQWIANYYITPIGEVLKNIIPPKLKIAEKRYIQLTGISDFEKQILSKDEKRILEFVGCRKKPISIDILKRNVKTNQLEKALEMLLQKGIVKIIRKGNSKLPKIEILHLNPQLFSSDSFFEIEKNFKRKQRQLQILQRLYEIFNSGVKTLTFEELRKEFPITTLRKIVQDLIKLGFLHLELKDATNISYKYTTSYNFPNELNLPLTSEQEKALNEIFVGLEISKYKSYLLFGVTGSGKTLIYMQCIKKCIEQGKSSIILVPEISLTPQLIERFNNAFPNQIALLHSRLSPSERVRNWLSILNGEKKIVIGPRSAIFAPSKNLGLIIIDEEHEPTYKQDEPVPRYNARDVALMRGKIENAVVILGSATPSVNTFYASKLGKHKLLTISQRADGAKLPNIILVDMLEKRRQKKTFSQFSDTLLNKIVDRLNKKEGIILFQNRRGFGLFVECRFCGYIPRCPECEVSLTYHKLEQKLKCHYCGFEKKYEATCPKCGKSPMLILGYGTQRIEEELKTILNELEYFPKIERFDLDVVLKKPEKNEILQKFYFGEIDILVGTQLIAKGLDFERVTLVGILNADLQLNIPDYTANERAFQLFTQVAGRAGRRSELPGEVIIQTTTPNSYPIEAFVNNDYETFFKKEIHYRKKLNYPPFVRLVSIEIQWKNVELKPEILDFLKNFLENFNDATVLGPVVPIIPKQRGWNRKVFLLKINRMSDPNFKKTSMSLKKLYIDFHKKYQSRFHKLIIDVDAQFFLI
ncbi:MAG: replication restart helicase PriA [Candidatus Kapaibacteriota bacterium]|jgi:primosomal protein N' (replication factor Y)